LWQALRRLFGLRAKPAPARVTVPGPKRVLLMRHAEKTGQEDDIHLSKTGAARAERLVAYIPQTFGTPDFIFAAAQSRKSIRSIETVKPLAAALGKDVRHDIEDKDFAALVRQLFSDPAYGSAIAVVCWHHRKMPDIARMLGAPEGSYPDPWPETLYDAIIDISYAGDGTPSARRVRQPF
jgi:phosphohistidine phosphatase SixA